MIAVIKGNVEIAGRFLQWGADIQCAIQSSQALFYTKRYENVGVTEYGVRIIKSDPARPTYDYRYVKGKREEEETTFNIHLRKK